MDEKIHAQEAWSCFQLLAMGWLAEYIRSGKSMEERTMREWVDEFTQYLVQNSSFNPEDYNEHIMKITGGLTLSQYLMMSKFLTLKE